MLEGTGETNLDNFVTKGGSAKDCMKISIFSSSSYFKRFSQWRLPKGVSLKQYFRIEELIKFGA